MKKRITLFLVFIILLNCGLYSLGRGEDKTDSYRLFAASYMTLNNPFFVALHGSISKSVEERGDRVVVLNPDYDQILQISQIEDLISLGVDGLFLNPVDWKGIRPALETAAKHNVPVFVVDAPVYDDQFVISTIVSDNREAGRLAANHLLEQRKKGTVVILDHPTNKPSIDRIEGFLSVLENNPDFHIAACLSAFGSLEGALPQMENAIQAHPDLNVVFGSNDPTSLGAVAALVAAKRIDSVDVYSVDGSIEGKDMVRSGMITGTSAQSPIAMGKLAVDILYDYLDGKDVPSIQYVPVYLITKDNIDDFPADSWQ